MSKRILVLNNAEQFAKWMLETFPKDADDERSDLEYVSWAICLQEAHVVANAFTTKDIASLFQNGVTSYNSMEVIQEWLNTYYDELNTAIEEGDVKLDENNTIDAETAEECGIEDLAEAISQDYAPHRAQDNEEDDD